MEKPEFPTIDYHRLHCKQAITEGLQHEIMKNAKIERAIAEKTLVVPLLPEVANRVMTLALDPDSGINELAKLIQTDPSLAGHVMRVANSAAYSPNSRIVSLQQAITRLGTREICNMAMAISMNSKMFNAPGYERHIKAIWQHALMTALWSKEVARSIKTNVEAAFFCGLLHSIGRPVLLQAMAEFNEPLLDDGDIASLWSSYESQANLIITKRWQLPAIVSEAIHYYARFSQAPTAKDMAATILLASLLANLAINSGALDIADELKPMLSQLNIYPDQLELIYEKRDGLNEQYRALTA